MRTWFRQLSFAQRAQLVMLLALLGYGLVRHATWLRTAVLPSDFVRTLGGLATLGLIAFAAVAFIREAARQARAFRAGPARTPRTPSAVIGQLLIPATVLGFLIAFVGWIADLRALILAAMSVVVLLPFVAAVLDNSQTPLFRRSSITRRHVAVVGLLVLTVRIVGGELSRGRSSDPFEWLMLFVVIPCLSVCWVAAQTPAASLVPAAEKRLHN